MADYNQRLSQLHQRVWQDELELPATIDEYGWIEFEPTALGELSIILREYNPEGMTLSIRFFDDPTYSRGDLMRICNSVNALEDAKLTVSDTYSVVRASIHLLLAPPGRMPDEGLLRAIVDPAVSAIKNAIDAFAKELQTVG